METMTGRQTSEAALGGLTIEKVWEAMMEDRQQIQELKSNMDASQRRIEKNLGGLGNSLGEFVESMFLAQLYKKFDKYGYTFTKQANQQVMYKDGRPLTEADSVLENGEYVMLVEIKTKMRNDFVDEHLARMEIFRQYMDERGDSRKIIGAVAGGTVPPEVLRYAQKHGLYVAVLNGETVSVADSPEGFKLRER